MYFKNIIKTLTAKSGILVTNFIIVLFTTRLWGAEGRGQISMLLANLSIIVTINNIFSGSSIAYHINKYNTNQLIKPAILWIFSVTLISSLGYYIFENNVNPVFLFIMTFFTSFTNFNLSVFVGKEQISKFNIFSFLIPAGILSILIILYYSGLVSNPANYFWSYLITYIILSIASLRLEKPALHSGKSIFSFQDVFKYGIKNELSYFIQFLNYRFSYYIIFYYLGNFELGIFSVAVSLVESLWVVSGSIALVHFSKVLNASDRTKMIRLSNKSALISISVTSVIGFIIALIPANWFGWIFGKDFTAIKPLFLLLLPGVLIQSFATVYGHFLSATGQMKPLIVKSVLGFIATLILTLLLIPRYGLKGACISTIISYSISSFYTWFAFYRSNKYQSHNTSLNG